MIPDHYWSEKKTTIAAIAAANAIDEDFALVRFYSYIFSFPVTNALSIQSWKKQYTKAPALSTQTTRLKMITATPIAILRLLTLHESTVGPRLLTHQWQLNVKLLESSSNHPFTMSEFGGRLVWVNFSNFPQFCDEPVWLANQMRPGNLSTQPQLIGAPTETQGITSGFQRDRVWWKKNCALKMCTRCLGFFLFYCFCFYLSVLFRWTILIHFFLFSSFQTLPNNS